MTFDEVMSQLAGLGNEGVRKQNAKRGAEGNYFGVKTGDLRSLAKSIKANPELARELWKSENIDAMLLATLLIKPKQLSIQEVDDLVRAVNFYQVGDWLSTNVVKLHPEKETRREAWMDSDHVFTARMGWSLTVERVLKAPDGLSLTGLLDRIEREMADAATDKQWMLNYCLAEIGINFAEHRERAIAIGEKIGAFRDYPTSKGCTSPYAPIWIAEMVARKS